MANKIANVGDDQAFWFKDWNGNVDFVAHNLNEFRKALKEVPAESLEFHLREDKNDLSSWLEFVMQKKDLGDSIWGVKNQCLTGDDLRKSLIRCFKPRGSPVGREKQSLRHTLRRALVGKR